MFVIAICIHHSFQKKKKQQIRNLTTNSIRNSRQNDEFLNIIRAEFILSSPDDGRIIYDNDQSAETAANEMRTLPSLVRNCRTEMKIHTHTCTCLCEINRKRIKN